MKKEQGFWSEVFTLDWFDWVFGIILLFFAFWALPVYFGIKAILVNGRRNKK